MSTSKEHSTYQFTSQTQTATSTSSAFDAARLLSRIPDFNPLSSTSLKELAGYASFERLRDRQIVLQAGEPADDLIAIIQGKVIIHIPTTKGINRVRSDKGQLLGETCLLKLAKRNADVTADGSLFIARFSGHHIREFASRHPQFRQLIFGVLSKRLVLNFIRSSPLFYQLDTNDGVSIIKNFKVLQLKAGSHITLPGHTLNCLWIPLSGSVLASKDETVQTKLLAGTPIGVDCVLDKQQSTYKVISHGDIVCLCIHENKIDHLQKLYPAFFDALRTQHQLSFKKDRSRPKTKWGLLLSGVG